MPKSKTKWIETSQVSRVRLIMTVEYRNFDDYDNAVEELLDMARNYGEVLDSTLKIEVEV